MTEIRILECRLETSFLIYKNIRKQIQQTKMLMHSLKKQKKLDLHNEKFLATHINLLTQQIRKIRESAENTLNEHPFYQLYLSKIPATMNMKWCILGRLSPAKFTKATAIYKYIGLSPSTKKGYDGFAKYILFKGAFRTLNTKQYKELDDYLVNKHIKNVKRKYPDKTEKQIRQIAQRRAIRDFLRMFIANTYDAYVLFFENSIEKPSYYVVKDGKKIYPLFIPRGKTPDINYFMGKMILQIKKHKVDPQPIYNLWKS
ncbi:MAG: hypothetical protein Q6363_009450 [Candidatus Njordarchaeota archaeon]